MWAVTSLDYVEPLFCFIHLIVTAQMKTLNLFPAREQNERLVKVENGQVVTTSLRVAEYFGKETPVVIVREATKVHQEILRGTAAELEEKYASRSWKGECVVVIGAPEEELSPEDETEKLHE